MESPTTNVWRDKSEEKNQKEAGDELSGGFIIDVDRCRFLLSQNKCVI